MKNSVEKYLLENGPSLSSEISEHLVKQHGISAVAARQRVSREGKKAIRLDLSFPRRARFLYLRDQSGKGIFWNRLESALLNTNSAYGYALQALEERGGIMPRNHFEIACGSPIRQQKHLSSSIILKRLQDTNLIKEIEVKGIGLCIYKGIHFNHVESLIPNMKARLLAEDMILRAFSDWLRKMGFVAYNQVRIRSDIKNPNISTTAWDLAGPSYLSPLVTFKSDGKPNPGFIACDILLTDEVSLIGIKPFLLKLNSLRSLKKVGKQLCFFVANTFHQEAFNKLKSEGISPTTVSTLFGNDVRSSLLELIRLLSDTALQVVAPEKIDKIFSSLGKIEGSAGQLRGAFFEYIVAEAMRAESHQIMLNRLCQTVIGPKEADVICVTNHSIKFIECKGYNPNKRVTLDEVNYWLNEQIPVFRTFSLTHPDWKNTDLIFEFWTTGTYELDALKRLEEASKNTTKYIINFKDNVQVHKTINNTKNSALIKTFSDHFYSHPMEVISISRK
ncbi:hypothetical protein DFP75_103281 [Marinomonas alcarazii]|uniref:Uncharacterized protein n=1 Tax=Marinomonas alcarazii TaxID=491949 RepID=A0A318V394_9GAMM|nr:nuclease-related domain-containing protein [Marinomonas alcarazii]PYF82453.1 hypothetical protein DFP75_103281 [Marinomonas alcarazii]